MQPNEAQVKTNRTNNRARFILSNQRKRIIKNWAWCCKHCCHLNSHMITDAEGQSPTYFYISQSSRCSESRWVSEPDDLEHFSHMGQRFFFYFPLFSDIVNCFPILLILLMFRTIARLPPKWVRSSQVIIGNRGRRGDRTGTGSMISCHLQLLYLVIKFFAAA